MPNVVRLTAADVVRRPWKNGRGTTDELLLVPREGDFASLAFDWRVARAGVVEDGPFSAFPGFERVLVVVAGAGLRLAHGDAAPPADVVPLVPYRFAGEWPTTASLPAGPVQDVNVLLRRDAVEGEVRVVRGASGAHALRGAEAFVHALVGGVVVRAGDAPPVALAPGEGVLLLDLAAPTPCRVEGAGAAHAVTLVVDVRRPRTS